jgi:DNA-damage-inducible protein D
MERMVFFDIRHEENGIEFWYARELMELLEYAQWRNFEKTIEKAKTSCENNRITVKDHFADVSKMIKIGKGGNFVQIGIDAEDYYRIEDLEKDTDE